MTRVVIVGGGLAGGLLALRLRGRPDTDVCVIERGERLGGNHTWSFHEHDLTAAGHYLVAPLVERRWPSHEVRFPAYVRRLRGGYASVTSARFDAVLEAALGRHLLRGVAAASLGANGVTLDDGREMPADLVVDARGPGALPPVPAGFQVFLGRDLALARDHHLERPLIMDATVDQAGGFRFMYALPWTDRTLLVEDTCYGGPHLDRESARARIAAWTERQGYVVRRVTREEEGVLPLPLGGDFEHLWPAGSAAAPLGVRAGLFHATTGYSLPEAARTAESIASLPVLDTASVRAHVEARSRAAWRRQSFFRRLNRLLLLAASPGDRYRVLERFYRLPEPLVSRFYAGEPTLADKLRVLAGRPPVSLLRAARVWRAAAGLEAGVLRA